MIRKATLEDLDRIKSITEACAEDMISRGIYQWNENYPSKAVFKQDILKEELYVLEIEKKVNACIMFSDTMDEVYRPVKWITENRKNLYVHRLAVHPTFQKQKYGQKLMAYAEQFALNNHYQSIRLDTFSQNKSNQRFYETRGFQRLGTIYFPQQSKHPFYCYEKILLPS